MNRKRALVLVVPFLYLLAASPEIRAQSETQKIERGAQFSVIRFANFDSSLELIKDRFPVRNKPDTIAYGVGGRFTYNILENFAIEAEVNFFPEDQDSEGGRKTQFLIGPKFGVRKEKVGVFAKVRPGFITYPSFQRVVEDVVNESFALTVLQRDCASFFALDVGGVFEIYPSRRTIVRFDIGDTIIHYRSLQPRELNPEFTRHNLQYSAGFGFRF